MLGPTRSHRMGTFVSSGTQSSTRAQRKRRAVLGTARRQGGASVARREVVVERPVRRVVPNSDGDHVGGAEVDARPDSSVYGQLVEDRLAVPVPQPLRRRNQVE